MSAEKPPVKNFDKAYLEFGMWPEMSVKRQTLLKRRVRELEEKSAERACETLPHQMSSYASERRMTHSTTAFKPHDTSPEPDII